jgi:hypothetical protein
MISSKPKFFLFTFPKTVDNIIHLKASQLSGPTTSNFALTKQAKGEFRTIILIRELISF